MPNVKIELNKGETPEEAEELLLKAFNAQRDGSLHDGKFHDPAMEDLSLRLIQMHDEEQQKMLQEIIEELEKEYADYGDI
jgi:hypothetical protein